MIKIILLLFCCFYCCWSAFLCATDHLSLFCLMTLAHIVGAADVTQTYKWHCLEIILFLMRDLGTQKKNKHHPESYFLPKDIKFVNFLDPLLFTTRVLCSVESIYYQSAEHVLACLDFWAILWWMFLQKCNKYKNCAHQRLSIQNNLFLSGTTSILDYYYFTRIRLFFNAWPDFLSCLGILYSVFCLSDRIFKIITD